MRRQISIFLVAYLCPALAWAATPLKLTASDGVTIYGERLDAAGPAKAVILLFHQAQANLGEYAGIAPRLAKSGFDVIAIDQRSGGNLFKRENQTVHALKRSAEYLDALPDLEAALAYARDSFPGKPVIVWGSSYSASLVFLLAARHPDDIAAILAFSPDEYFGAGKSVADAAAKVRAPVFVTSDADKGEIAAAKAILAASPAQVKIQFVPKYGQHGSSILHQNADPKGAEAAWSAVDKFLKQLHLG